MQAEDAQWEATYARHRGKPNILADAACAEIDAGTTQPLFDEDGEVNV